MTLEEAVDRLRRALGALPEPFGPARLPPPVAPGTDLGDLPARYAAFLRLADGASAGSVGSVRLWPLELVRASRDDWWLAELPGGVERWLPVGDVCQNPVCLDRTTGELWYFSDLDVVWYTQNDFADFAPLATDLVDLLDRVVLGPDHFRIVDPFGLDEGWRAALSALG